MRILLVGTRWPWPPRRGNQLRSVQMAGWLAAEHTVTLLVPPGDEPAPGDLPYRLVTYRRSWTSAGRGVVAAALSGRPLQSGFYDSRDLRAGIRHLLPESDLVIVQTVRLAALVAEVGEVPLAVDFIDSLALNFERRAEVDRPWRRALLLTEAARLLVWERRLVARACWAWVVAERDAKYLGSGLGAGAVARLQVLPVAVPAPAPRPTSVPKARPVTLVITGNLGYFPTVDGTLVFLREVWPLLAARRPDLRLVLAGARPSSRLRRAAAAAGPRVEIADSPPDLAPILAAATIALAPARCGSGVPVKVLEAWAAGVPVVAHPWTAAGAGAAAERDLLVAAEPAEWVVAIERLLDDSALLARVVSGGRERLAEFEPGRLQAALLAAVRSLDPHPPTPSP